MLEKHGAKLTVFVDASYLHRLHGVAERAAQIEHSAIAQQLRDLVARGHDAQLHVHPHWVDSHYANGNWRIDTSRYRLHDFSIEERTELVSECKRHLDDVSGQRSFAYRAGGWCMQPFAELADALYDNGVWLDSTVFPGGLSEDKQRGFDFREAPNESWWRFDTDPLVKAPRGRFVELPIGSEPVGPAFFWTTEIRKRLDRNAHSALGDGGALKANWRYYFNRLTRSSISPASIDGSKARLINTHFRRVASRCGTIVNLMGHPKALTEDSLAVLDSTLSEKRFQGVTISEIATELNLR